ncbi:hypothetical protein VZC42_27585, partial [Raoultella ornithinolytica]|uniref:hypothetical protein n=1 Tax=Raoultella ornithinolytica TaxID=54291 RepID=UPI0038A318D5
WDARKRAYCLKIQPATGSFARNLIYSTKPIKYREHTGLNDIHRNLLPGKMGEQLPTGLTIPFRQ